MPTAKWLWDWLKDRPPSRRPADPLSRYASLSIQRLEERRVLSISVTVDSMSPGDVTVDIGDDGGTATLTVVGNDLIIDDPDSANPADTYTIDLSTITSLTIQGDTGTQTVEFVGDNPFLLPALDINNTVEVAVIAQPITVTTGHLDIHVADFIHGGTTADPAAALTTDTGSIFLTVDAGGMTLGSLSSAGSVSLDGGDITLDGTVTANGGSISILGDALDVNAAVTAATSLTLDGTSITIDGALEAQNGDLSITATDDINIGADGDITLQDGQLTIAAGNAVDNQLTMADGATITVVTNSGGVDHSLTAGGDIQLGELTLSGAGNGLSITAGGAILDGNGAAANITAGTVSLEGTSIGASTDRLETAVTSLSLITTGDGYITQTGDLDLEFAVTSGLAAVDVTGHLTLATSSAGTMDLESTAGLDVDGALTATSHISLSTTGSASDLTIKDGAAVTTTGGDIVISADGLVTIDENVGTTGAGTLTVTGNAGAGARQILIQNGAVVSTENGTLALDADQGTQQSGDFAGVVITGTGTVVEVTGSAGLIIDGRGGDTGNDQHGVLVENGALVRGGSTSAVVITGVGGASSGSDNAGVVVTGAGSSLTSTGANLQITGTGGGSSSSSGNVGVLVAGASITAGGSGTTTVEGTGGLTTGDSNYGVSLVGANSTISSAGGQVTVTGTGGGTAGTDNIGVKVDGSLGTAGISSTGTVTVTGVEGSGADSLGVVLTNGGSIANTANGLVTITTDSLTVTATSTVGAGNGTVTLQQRTAGVAIDLGSETDVNGGPLALSDAELNQITAGTLVIGNASAGSITLRDAIAPAGVSALQLVTGDAIVDDSANGADITVANLALMAANGIGATDALETAVTNLAFRNTTTGAVNLENTGSLTIAAVGALDGTAGNEVGNFSGATTAVSAASPLTFAIDTTSVGSATYTAGESSDSPTFADDLTINSGVTVSVTGAGADLTLNAGDDILINGGTAAADNGALTLQAGFNDTDGSGTIEIGGTLSASTYASLSSLTGITDSAGAVLDLTSLELLGTGDVVLDNGHDIDALAAQLAGNLTYQDTDGFTVGAVNTSTGITLSTTGDALDLTTTAGAILLAADVTTDGDQNYHSAVEVDDDITLAADSGDVTFAGQVDASTSALTSDLTITAENVTFQANVGAVTPLSALSVTAAGDIVTTADVVVAGNVDLTASGTTGVDIGSSLTSQTGTLTLIADGTGDVSVTGSLAAAGDLAVRANGTAGGSIEVGGNIDSSAGAVELTADGALEIQGTIAADTTLTATTSAGAMTFHDTLTTTTGSITLTNAGLLTISGAVNSGNAVTQDGAGDVALGADVTASDAILFESAIILLADITLTSSTGGVTLQGTVDADSTNGMLAEGLTIAAGNGAISLGAAVGAGTALEFLDASTSGDLTAQSTITTTGLMTLSGDTVTLNGALDAGTSLTLTSTSDIDANANLTAGTFLDVNAGTGASLAGDLLADTALTVTATNGGIDVTGSVTSTSASVLLEALAGSAAIHVGGNVLAATDATIDNATAEIDLDGTLTATSGAVDLDAGTSIDIVGTATAGTTADLDAGTGVVLGGDLLADTAITVTASNGGIDITGAVTSTNASILLEALAGNAAIHVGGNVLADTDVTIDNATAGIDLDGTLTATSGTVDLDAGTSIDVVGSVTAGTTADLDAGTSVLLGASLLADTAVTVTATNSGIDITGDVTSTNASVLLEALAGNAAIHVSGNVLADTDVTINNTTAGIDLDGILTATTGFIDLDAGTAIAIVGNVTAGTTADLDAGTSVTLGGDLLADTAITVTASNGGIDITGTVTSTNASILLEALAGNAAIHVGGDILADTDVTIDNATAGIDLDGTLTATTGLVDLDAATSLEVGGAVTAGTTADLDAGTSISLGGGLEADDAITVTAANGGIETTGSVTSNNASVLLEVLAGTSDIQVGGDILAGTSVTLDNATAGIDVAGTVTAGTTADLDAGTSVVLGGDLLADTAITVTASNGGIDITGAVTSTNASLLLEALAGNAVIHVGGNVLADTDVTIDNATAGIDLDGTLTATTGLIDLDAASAIEVNGAVTAGTTADLDAGTSINLGAGLEADDAITLTASNGGIEITGDVTSSTTSVLLEVLAGTSAIHVGGSILADTSVTLDNATADIDVDGNITAGTTADLDAGTGVTLGGDLLADTAITVTASNGGIDITGDVTSTNASILLEALAGNAVIHVGGNVLADTSVTIDNATAGIDLDGTLTATSGAVDLDADTSLEVAGTVTAGTTADLDAGTSVTLGADLLADTAITVTASNGGIDITGVVTSTNASILLESLAGNSAIHVGGNVLADTNVTINNVTAGIDLDGTLTATMGAIDLDAAGALTITGNVSGNSDVTLNTTVGLIDLDGDIESLAADVVIEAASSVTIDGQVTAFNDVEIRSLLQAAAVSLNGAVTATNGDLRVLGQTIIAQQALSAGGEVHLDSSAGTTLATSAATVSAVTGITIDGPLTTAAHLLVDNGFLTINGNVTLTQAVLFDTDVDNAGNEATADITITGTVTLATFTLTLDAGTGGDMDLQGAVSGTGDLVVEQGNALEFAAISVNDLTINDATTSIVFHGPIIATAVGMDAGDISVSSSGTLNLEDTLTADGSVMLSAAGGLMLCADLSGTSFVFTDAVELCDDVTITATGLVEFQDTIDSEANQAYSLTINTAGLTNFEGAIGSGTDQELGSLTTDAAGTTQIAANVTTAGDQQYLDAVTLTGNVTLTGVDGNATGEAIEFGSTLAGGGFSLTIVGGGAFAGAVSGVNAFAADRIDTESTVSAVSVNVTGTADVGGDITTTQTQVYGGAVLLTGDAVLSSSGVGATGNIAFESTLDGAHTLEVDTAGTTTFEGLVGAGTELTSLTTSGGGSTVISTAAITADAIDLQDNVTLTTSSTLTGNNSISFGGTVSGQAGTEDLTVNSGGAADFAGSISTLDQVAVNAAGTTTFSGDINVSGALTTTGGGVTKIDTATIAAGSVSFSDAVELCQDLLVTAGSITFGSTLDEAAMATGSDLTLTITNPNLTTGDIGFTGAVGSTTALDSLTVTTANDVTFSSTVRLVGDLEQAAGTGTTAFQGTSGTGIGGQLLVTTNEVTFSTADMLTVGAIVITAQNGIALNANAGLNAGASTITLRANQDNTGNQGFSQASSAVVQTTSNSLSAVVINVGGTGTAAISDVRAGTTSGVVSITAGGQISDNLSGEGANITAHAAALRGAAGIGIGAGADVDIDTAVDELAFSSTDAGVNISNTGTLTLTAVDGLTTSLAFGGGTLFAAGSLTVAMNTQVGGTFNFIAGDDAAAINDLTISADITHLTGQGELTFQAGDDIVQTAGTIQCIGAPVGDLSRINFTADHEASGTDGDRGGITQTGGNVLAAELQIRSYDAVAMDQATNDAEILAAVVTGAGASFTFRDANDLTVSSISGMGGVVGLTTNGGDVTLTTGGQLILGGTGEDILAAGATVSITAGNGFNEGAGSTITSANLLLLGTGTFTVAQQNQVSVLAADINGTLVYTDANALSVGTVGATSGITTSNDDVRLNTGGNLTVDGDVSLGSGDLTLNVTGAVTQTTGNDLAAAGLQLLGTGSVTLNNVGNNVATLAANYNGTISYTDANGLVIGTVSDSSTGATTSGIATSNDDVKLTVLAGGLAIGDAVGTAGLDDIALGAGDLTLNVTGAVTQTTGNDITAGGLQLLGSGTVTLTNTTNNITKLAANYDGTIAYTDANTLTIGTVTDGPSAMTTNGITTSNDDVRLNVLTGGLTIGDGGTSDDIALGTGNLTLNVTGAVTQTANNDITAAGLQLLESGTVTLGNTGNNVSTLAANYNGTIVYTDANTLTVGSVTDGPSATTTNGITTSNDDVRLNVLAGGLTIGDGGTNDDVALGTGNLTLNVTGAVTQTADNDITAAGLQLLGSGSVTLTNTGNNVTTLAANYDGTIAYTDANTLTVGSVTDGPSATTTNGITTSNDDVRLNVLAGGLTIGDGGTNDDIALGTGDLTLNVTGAITQITGNDITAAGLQLLSSGTVTLTNTTNNVTTLAANYDGTIAYTDANTLTVGTVTDGPSATTTNGITTSNDDVKLNVLTGGLTIGDGGTNDDIALGTGDLTLNVTGTVKQTTGNDITAAGLQLLGSGTVTLTNTTNNVSTLAANYNGTIAYTDANGLTIGTVTDGPSATTTNGITTSNDDVRLNVLAGGVTIGDGGTNDDVSLGSGNLTLNVTGAVTQTANNDIAAAGLQLLGSGSVALTNTTNNVAALAANFDGVISYADADALTIGTVADGPSMTSTSGITTQGADVTISALGNLTVNQAISTSPGSGGVITVTGGTINAALTAGAGDITLTGGNPDLIINVDQTSATSLTLQATRDVIINALVTTTGPGADIVVTADTNNDGVGGVQVTAAGQLVAADAITLTGSDFFATAMSSDSVRIDADGASQQLQAGGNILLQHQSNAPATADLVIEGRILSTGGDITLNARDGILLQSSVVASAGTGDITFQDRVVLTGDLQVMAGGQALFQSTVDDDANGATSSDLIVSAAGLTRFTGAVGSVSQMESLVLNGGGVTEICANVSTVNQQTYTDAVTLCADVTLTSTAAGAIVFESTIDSDTVTPRALTVTTSGLTDFQGAVGQTQALRTLTTNGGGSTQFGGGLVRTTGVQSYQDNVVLTADVTWQSVAASSNGANITVGGTIDGNTFDLTMDAGTQGDITLSQAVTDVGQFTVNRGAVQQYAALQVAGLEIQAATTSVTFGGAVVVTDSASVTSSGTITQASTFSAGQDVEFDAGGTLQVQGSLTAGQSVTLLSDQSIALTAAVTATTGSLVVDAGTTLSATQVLMAGNAVELTAVSGITLGSNADVMAGAGGITVTGTLTTAADFSTDNGAIVVTGPVTLTGAVVWDSDKNETGGADITLQQAVATGDFALTMDAGSLGDLTFQSTITGGGDVTIEDGAIQQFAGAITVDNFTIQDATTSVTLNGPVIVIGDVQIQSGGSVTALSTIDAGSDVSLTATGAIELQAAVEAQSNVSLTSTAASITLLATVDAVTGDLSASAGTTLSASQALTAGDAVSLAAGTTLTLAETADINAGVGGVSLMASQILTAAEITTANGDVTVTGAVQLTGDVTIDTGASGAVLVTGSINGTTAFQQSLTLSTGTGDITVTGDIGTTAALQNLVIADADDVNLGGGITAEHLLQQSGLGTTTIAGAVNTYGASGIQLTTAAIVFTAGTASMDSHGNPIVLTADAITLPTTFTNATGSTVTLQTLSAGTSIGLEDSTSDLNFTDAQLDTIHSQNLIIGSATQTAGIRVGTDGLLTQDENLTLLTAGNITVAGSLSATSTNAFLLDAGADISVNGTLSTLSGSLQLLADQNISMGSSGLVQSTSGNVTILADADGDANGAGGGITMANGAVINSGTGTLLLQADQNIVIGQLITANATALALQVTSLTGGIVDGGDAGVDIVLSNANGVATLTAVTGVGSATGSGADAALETQVSQLQVVNSTSGQIAIDEVDAITILGIDQQGPGAVLLTAGGTLTLAAGSIGVQTQGGAISITTTGAASDLVLMAALNSLGGDITLTVGDDLTQASTAPITTEQGQLTLVVAGDASLGGIVQTAGGDLTGTIGGNLLQGTLAPISTGGGNVSLTVTGTSTLSAAITTAGGDLLLDGVGNTTILASAPISTLGGEVTLLVDGQLSLASQIATAGGDVNLTIGGDVSLAATAAILSSNGDFAADVAGAVTMANGSVINTALGTITLQAGDNITIGQLITTNATAQAVLIESTSGAVIDGGDTGGADVIANAPGAVVTILAATGVGSATGGGSDAALETQINTLVLQNTTSGQVAIDEVDSLQIRELTQSGSGNVTVNTVGTLTLIAGQPGLSATTGLVTLQATAAASDIVINSLVRTTSGNINISAANDVQMGAGSQVLTLSGDITVVADADGTQNGNGGAMFMANGAALHGGTGTVTVRADENITVGRIDTSNTVSLTSHSGGIVDGGDLGGADIVASTLVIQSVAGIGSANALETSVGLLAAANLGSGAIRIANESVGALTIGQVGSVSGVTNTGSTAQVIDIVNVGGLNVNAAVRNATGGSVQLVTVENGGDNDHLIVNATITASGGNGDITLTAGNNLVINDSGNGTGDDISVVNGGEILGTAGGDVLIGSDVVVRSASGAVTNIDPVLINVLTPQISALGVGTLTMTVQRPLEIGTVIIIDWGDGTVETFVVTEANQQTLTFQHQYIGPPDPANPAADIPISITVQNPGVTNGAGPSETPNTVKVANADYVPNIRFAANGEVLASTDVGELNYTVFTGVFQTPGDGLASFAFDLTPEVKLLDFPQQTAPDASLLTVTAPLAQNTTDNEGIRTVDTLGNSERVVILEVLGPDGSVQATVILAEDVLDDISGVVENLPDGRYRFLLREPGEPVPRLLQMVDVHDGKIADDLNSTLDRPRSLRVPAAAGGDMPAVDETAPPPADALQPVNESASKPQSESGLMSWRSRRAWQLALNSAIVVGAEVDGVDVDEAGSAEIAEPAQPALLAEPAEAVWAGATPEAQVGFSRAARLFRKFSVT